MKPTMSRNAVPSGTASTGNARSRASSSSAGGTRLKTRSTPIPSALIPPASSSAISPRCAATLPFSRIPAVSMIQRALEEARRLLDVDRVRARDLAVERARAAAQQREPEILLGDQITEDQCGLHPPRV